MGDEHLKFVLAMTASDELGLHEQTIQYLVFSILAPADDLVC